MSHVAEGNLDESVSDTVVRAVAEHQGVDPVDLDERLGEAIDPDALDALYGPDDAGPEVSFAFAGCEVVVRGDRSVEVSPADG